MVIDACWNLATSHTYELYVKGHLGDRLSHSLVGTAEQRRADGTTVWSGRIVDQVALYGLINSIRDQG